MAELLRAYGAEVFGFLVAIVGRRCARATYDAMTTRLSRATFEGTCAPRIWMYALAREELRRRKRKEIAPHVVVRVGPYRDPCVDGSAILRRLPLDDRALLVLRVDRRWSWREIAMTTLGVRAKAARIGEEIARLRHRFSVVRVSLGFTPASRNRGGNRSNP